MSDTEIEDLQDTEETGKKKKNTVKEAEKAAHLQQRFLELNKNTRTEAIAVLEKIVQLEKDSVSRQTSMGYFF